MGKNQPHLSSFSISFTKTYTKKCYSILYIPKVFKGNLVNNYWNKGKIF